MATVTKYFLFVQKRKETSLQSRTSQEVFFLGCYITLNRLCWQGNKDFCLHKGLVVLRLNRKLDNVKWLTGASSYIGVHITKQNSVVYKQNYLNNREVGC